MTNFDDYTDDEFLTPEDREARYQRTKAGFAAFEQDQARYQAEKQQQQQKAEADKIFQDTLKEYGISQKAYAELLQKDPEFIKQTYKEQVRDFASKVARKRDPKSGRFLPGKAETRAPQQQKTDDFYQPAQPHSVMGRGSRDWEGKMAKYKDPKQRAGTNEEVADMFKAFTSGDPAFSTDSHYRKK
jgi:hypothetical protein